ncbi:MAG: YcgN family cysteine cluster protein [Gammaproteobacteria bacterium]|nr:YcgN family cysteine cluster protein [Gammaproteobacteria bacterium]
MKNFWQTKTLRQMSSDEWEALCDRCGKCCLHRYQARGSRELQFTLVCCRYLERTSGACADYPNRLSNQPECVSLSPDMLDEPDWLPQSCAYRLLAEGKPLPDWHPLISGDPGSVDRAGQFIGRFAVSELEAADHSHYLVDWIR